MNKILFILLLLVSGVATAQQKRVTLQEQSISFKEAFAQIEQQTGYSIAYNETLIDVNTKQTLSLRNKPLEKALSKLLKGTGLTYKIKGYHIIIYQAPKVPQQPLVQTIKGEVLDEASGKPIAFASVSLLNDSRVGVLTDSAGHFALPPIAVGRYHVKVSYMGYEPRVVSEIVVTSAKEVHLTVPLKENTYLLDEVIVRPEVDKEKTVNPLALTGGRMLSIDEAARFAGGFDDPARLVTSLAGVAGNINSNAMSVRGNTPQFSQWRMEGIEIPNPTHFPDMTGLGGGLLTGLSSHLLGNSDFFNSAFPAEYSNALSGVFDMSLRTGNNQHHEHAFQIGNWGLDIASEGPLGKKNRSSYLVNYRYSYSGLMDAISGVKEGLDYQDLSFKLNFPTAKAGTFTLWGIGLLDNVLQQQEEDRSKWEYIGDRQKNDNHFAKGIIGVGHRLPLRGDAYLKTTLALTHSGIRGIVDQMDDKGVFHRMDDIKSSSTDVILTSYLNKKFGANHTNRSGFTLTRLSYDLDFKATGNAGIYEPMKQIARGAESDMALSAFSNSVISLNRNVDASIGITGQFFSLNNHWTLEPRVSFKWKLPHRQSLAFAYGLHSTRIRLDYYYIQTPKSGNEWVNKNLNFSKAHHFSMSYGVKLSDFLVLKAEPYYQSLFDIPVEPGTSFSILNYNGYILNKRLINEGKGRNYGVDITLERYLDRGWYGLLTGSLFKSEYLGGDNVWRNTRMNRRFIVNALAGKEWTLGRRKNKTFSANVRMSYQGGDCYTPIDVEQSEQNQGIKEDDSQAYSLRLPNAFTTDLTLRYKVSRKKVAHELAVMLLNINGFKQTGYAYNMLTNSVERKRGASVVIGISWKIYF